jgi:hypothetical protein
VLDLQPVRRKVVARRVKVAVRVSITFLGCTVGACVLGGACETHSLRE